MSGVDVLVLLGVLLAAPPTDPTVPGAALPVDEQWRAVLACPKVTLPSGPAASGVVIGVKDGFGYLLTAAHAAPFDQVAVAFTDRNQYPKQIWFTKTADVVGRWPDPDLALVRFPLENHTVVVLPLAPPGERPKTFPAEALSVGVNGPDQAATVLSLSVLGKDFVRRSGKEPAFFWKTDRPSQPGRSGGALLDTRGRVIGLASANRGEYGYYTHLDEIQAALKRGGFGWLVPPRP
jgi:S1-C subfamily serine protease